MKDDRVVENNDDESPWYMNGKFHHDCEPAIEIDDDPWVLNIDEATTEYCPHSNRRQVPCGIGSGAEYFWYCPDCGEEI